MAGTRKTPKKNDDDGVLIATDSGVWVAPDGSEYPFHAGITRVRVGHPLARAIPEAFKPVDVHYEVERFHGETTETRVAS